jgi:hypothetical protein
MPYVEVLRHSQVPTLLLQNEFEQVEGIKPLELRHVKRIFYLCADRSTYNEVTHNDEKSLERKAHNRSNCQSRDLKAHEKYVRNFQKSSQADASTWNSEVKREQRKIKSHLSDLCWSSS